MAEQDLKLKVSADTTQAKSALDKLKGSVSGISDVFGLASKVSIAGFVAGLGFSIKAAAEQEAAIVKLQSAFKRYGVESESAIKDQLDFASALQKTTTYADETITEAQALIANFGATGDALKQATKATLDLSAATGTDLKSAAMLVGKAFAGETGTLSRYGIILADNVPRSEKFTAALAAINKQFGGAAQAQAESFSGKLTQFKNAIGEVAELIGGAFLPVLTKLVSAFTTVSQVVSELDPQVLIRYFVGGEKAVRAYRKELELANEEAKRAGVGGELKFKISLTEEKNLKDEVAIAKKYLDDLKAHHEKTAEARSNATELYLKASLSAQLINQKAEIKLQEEKLVHLQNTLDLQVAANKTATEKTTQKTFEEATKSFELQLSTAQKFRNVTEKEELKLYQTVVGISKMTADEKRKYIVQTNKLESDVRTDKEKKELETLKRLLEGQGNYQASVAETDLVALEKKKTNLEALLEANKGNADKSLLISDALAKSEVDITHKKLSEKKALENAFLDVSQEIGRILISDEENKGKAIGNAIKNNLKARIATDAAYAIAKTWMEAVALAIPTLGASLGAATLATGDIVVKAAAAISVIDSVKFQKGGIVPGNQPAGDQVSARVNSGEMILNKEQQGKLFTMINGGSGGGGGLTVNINGGIFMADRRQAQMLAKMIDEEMVVLGRQRQRLAA